MRELENRMLKKIEDKLGPRLILKLFKMMTEDRLSNWKLAEDFDLPLFYINFIRARPEMCLRYVLSSAHANDSIRYERPANDSNSYVSCRLPG